MNIKNNKNNNDVAQQKLIDNLKKQLANKRDIYNEMIYRAAIIQVVDEKFPVSKNSYLNIDGLPSI